MKVIIYGVILLAVSMMLAVGCDNTPPTTQVDDAAETNDFTPESFFAYSDSSNFLLVTAVDTLRERNNKNGFIYEFIDERGYPVWDEGSAFYSKGHPVLLIPVVRPAEQRVTGLAYISVENSQPIYRWVPRGADFEASGLPDKEALETLLLGYEKKVFGTNQDSERSIQIKQEARTIKSDDVPTANEMWVKVTHTICSGVDAGANGDTTWECDTYSEWIYLSNGGGGSSGGTGGDDGGSGGGSGGFGGDDGSGDGDCSNKAKMPVDGCEDDPSEDEAKTLQELLQENEYLLLDGPCDEIENYAALAEYTPPQSVINKLEQEYYGDIDILSIQDAAGTVVNMDYFSVNVSSLPSGMSASDLLREIRMSNINNFINTDFASFSPYDYTGYSYDEETVWHSSNPLGAVLSIDIPGDNGSVVVSDFNSESWTFSTVSDPWNFDHPVSGNRTIGFMKNNDGSYTFFTRGIDRFTQGITGELAANILTGGQPFSGSDNLWQSFQQGIKDYVDQHGGSASINQPETLRPDWNQVQRVFDGLADEETLGCN